MTALGLNRHAIFLLTSVATVFVVGLIMVFNTTSAEALDKFREVDTHHAFLRQLVFGFISLFAGYVIWKIGYRHLIEISPLIFFFLNLLLILVFVPGIGQQINGASRWIGFPGLSLQPSEFIKPVFPLYFLYLLKKQKSPLTFKGFIFILLNLSIPLFLVIIEPDNGTAAILLVSFMVLFFITKIKSKYWALPSLILVLIGGAFAMQMKHVHDRIAVYLHPENDLLGKGHQPYQAKIAAGSGGLYGKGLGESLQKLNYLPEARSDYIAAIYAEETGFIGVFGLIILYMLIAYLGFYISAKSKDPDGFYLGIILTFILSFQAFLNLGVVSGLLPSKGTNLPFFSQGGSSLIANSLLLAVILNIAKSNESSISSRWNRRASSPSSSSI